MTKEKYLLEMKAYLSFVDEKERTLILKRYGEIFDECGKEREDQLSDALGTPLRQVLRVKEIRRKCKDNKLPVWDSAEDTPIDNPLAKLLAQEKTAVEAARIADEERQRGTEEKGVEEEATSAVGLIGKNDEQEETAAEQDRSEELPAEPERLSEEAAPVSEETAADTLPVTSEEPGYEELSREELSEAAGAMLAAVDFGGETPPEQKKEQKKDPYEQFLAGIDAEQTDEKKAAPSGKTKKSKTKKAKKTKEKPKKKATGGRTALAVVLTPFLVLLSLLGVALSLVFAAIPLSLCVIPGAAAGYLALYAVTNLTYLPDLLAVIGAAVVLLAVAVLFLCVGLRALVGGLRRTVGVIGRLYGRILGKGDEE